jgi:hypothetical protein
VQYQFTAQGRLQVKAQLARSGQALRVGVRRALALSEGQIADWSNLLARGGGLKAIHALLPKHQRERQSPETAPPVATPQQPPPLPGAAPAPGEFALDPGADPTAARRKKRKMTPRKLAILLGGYVISALLGTAIGYYILMRMDPSYNYLRLPLPGLRVPPN